MSIYLSKIIKLIKSNRDITPEQVLFKLLEMYFRANTGLFKKVEAGKNQSIIALNSAANKRILDNTAAADAKSSAADFAVIMKAKIAQHFNAIDITTIEPDCEFGDLCRAFLAFYPEYIHFLDKKIIFHFKPEAYLYSPQGLFVQLLLQAKRYYQTELYTTVISSLLTFTSSHDFKFSLSKSSILYGICEIIQYSFLRKKAGHRFVDVTNDLLDNLYAVNPASFKSSVINTLQTNPVQIIVTNFFYMKKELEDKQILIALLLQYLDYGDNIRKYALKHLYSNFEFITANDNLIIIDKLLKRLEHPDPSLSSDEIRYLVKVVETYPDSSLVEGLYGKLLQLMNDPRKSPVAINLFLEFAYLPIGAQLQELCKQLLNNLELAEKEYSSKNILTRKAIARLFNEMDCEQLPFYHAPESMIKKLVDLHETWEIREEKYIIPELIFKLATSPSYNREVALISNYIRDALTSTSGGGEYPRVVDKQREKIKLVVGLASIIRKPDDQRVYRDLYYRIFNSNTDSYIKTHTRKAVNNYLDTANDVTKMHFINSFYIDYASDWSLCAQGEKLIFLGRIIPRLSHEQHNSQTNSLIDEFLQILTNPRNLNSFDINTVFPLLRSDEKLDKLLALVLPRLKQKTDYFHWRPMLLLACLADLLPIEKQFDVVSKLDRYMLTWDISDSISYRNTYKEVHTAMVGRMEGFNLIMAYRLSCLDIVARQMLVSKIIEYINVKNNDQAIFLLKLLKHNLLDSNQMVSLVDKIFSSLSTESFMPYIYQQLIQQMIENGSQALKSTIANKIDDLILNRGITQEAITEEGSIKKVSINEANYFVENLLLTYVDKKSMLPSNDQMILLRTYLSSMRDFENSFGDSLSNIFTISESMPVSFFDSFIDKIEKAFKSAVGEDRFAVAMHLKKVLALFSTYFSEETRTSMRNYILDKLVKYLEDDDSRIQSEFIEIFHKYLYSLGEHYELSAVLTDKMLATIWAAKTIDSVLFEKLLEQAFGSFKFNFNPDNFKLCVDQMFMLTGSPAYLKGHYSFDEIFPALAAVPDQTCQAHLVSAIRMQLRNDPSVSKYEIILYILESMVSVNKDTVNAVITENFISFLNHPVRNIKDDAYAIFESLGSKVASHLKAGILNFVVDYMLACDDSPRPVDPRPLQLAVDIHSYAEQADIKRLYMLAYLEYKDSKPALGLELAQILMDFHYDFHLQRVLHAKNLGNGDQNVVDMVRAYKPRA